MSKQRLDSIDLLRGLVMIVMVLDHVRDFFHAGSQQFSPEDLTKTDAVLFFTRWITHFCAPVFVLLAGAGISFSTLSRDGNRAVSRFLIARGLWLIFLELTVLNFAFSFRVPYDILLLQVIWAIGWSMIAMAGLIWLPRRVLAVLAIAMILLHNTADGLQIASPVWKFLHVISFGNFKGMPVLLAYPLIPWIGVMAAGFCLGDVMRLEPDRRRTVLLRIGSGMTMAFVVLRFLNIYGDPAPWDGSSFLSFFRATKYPPSLIYLLMTLGPSLILLGWIDRARVAEFHPLRVFGRVPMFYYLLHFYLVHALAVVLGWLRYGDWTLLLRMPPAITGEFPPGFPQDYGYSLGMTYLIWAAVVVALYPPCRWYMQFKQRSRAAWTGYL